MKKIIAFLFLFQLSFGQVNPEEIDIAANDFENNFYEALKQKAIENYDKAIISLEKCLQKEPNNPRNSLPIRCQLFESEKLCSS